MLLLLSVAAVYRRYPHGSTDVLVPRAERCDATRPVRHCGAWACSAARGDRTHRQTRRLLSNLPLSKLDVARELVKTMLREPLTLHSSRALSRQRLALVSAKERADLVEAALGAAFNSAVNVPRNAPIGPRLDAAKARAI